jgi:hypothetical protein
MIRCTTIIEEMRFLRARGSLASLVAASLLRPDVLPNWTLGHQVSMASCNQDSATLSLHIASAANLHTHASAAFCALLLWSNTTPGGPRSPTAQPKYTSFGHVKNDAVGWNEKLQLVVDNPASAVLTVRVKDSRDALVGSCNIYLGHLRPSEPLDQWFQLHPIGHIRLKLTLKCPTQRAPSLATADSPYSSGFQAQVQRELERREAAARVEIENMRRGRSAFQSPLPSHIAMLVEAQNQAQENARLALQLRLQHQAKHTDGYPTAHSPHQQARSANFREMMGTAANISTVAANMQQLNGNGIGSSALGSVASIGLGALGLGPMAAFFGS